MNQPLRRSTLRARHRFTRRPLYAWGPLCLKDAQCRRIWWTIRFLWVAYAGALVGIALRTAWTHTLTLTHVVIVFGGIILTMFLALVYENRHWPHAS